MKYGAIVLAALLVGTLPALAQREDSYTSPIVTDRMSAPISRNLGSISGSIHTLDGHAVGNARVDLRSLRSGEVVASAFTSGGGSFQFLNVPNGSYEVVATSGLNEAHEQVMVASIDVAVSLQIAQRTAPTDGSDKNAVSVATLRVPDKARAEFKKAQAAMAKVNTAEAAAHVDKALAIYPDFAEALTLHGVLLLDEHKGDEAIMNLERAVQLDQSYPMAYVALGAAYSSAGRLDDAVRTIEHAIELSPSSWQAHFELGKALMAKSDYTGALRELNKTIDLRAVFPPIHLVRAHVLIALKNFTEARADLEQFLKNAPTGPLAEGARKTLEEIQAVALNR
jgi:Flp pilus assembly protein TadD